MKNLILLPLLLCCTLNLWAQSNSEVSREFEFTPESDASEFTIEIGQGTDELMFSVKSSIQSGDLKVSLISPSGKKEGGFRLQCTDGKNKVKTKSKSKSKEKVSVHTNTSSHSDSNGSSSVSVTTTTDGNSVSVHSDHEHDYSFSMTSSSSSKSKGNMNKQISNPEAGSWKVMIEPDKVEGNLAVKIMQASDQ